MGRLSLAIADTDEAYLESIVEFLIDRHPQRFQVSSFTNLDSLIKYISEATGSLDILLIAPELYSDSIPISKIGVLILLSTGRIKSDSLDFALVNKYQHADYLVSRITSLYIEKNQSEIISLKGDKRTNLIAVYSLGGGTGKTSIAASSCILSAQKGMSVFYMNIEYIHSQQLFFKNISDKNLTHIFYYLKEKNKNLALKIEDIRCIDPYSNVHYFSPPDSACEIDEISPEELKFLLEEFRKMEEYDVVFIDLSNSFDKRNLAIMEACDQIFLILTEDDIQTGRMKLFENELKIIIQKTNLNISEKISLILNKCSTGTSKDSEDIHLNGKAPIIKLPILKGFTAEDRVKCMFDTNHEFGQCISQLVSSINP